MASLPAGPEIERLIQLLAKLPGLGPRSARRAALTLLKKRDILLDPLANAMRDAASAIKTCETCGNLDTTSPCAVCRDVRRETHVLCVVEDVADLWALERAGVFRGRYHVLGGALSPIDGIDPDDLKIEQLYSRVRERDIREVVIATNPTTTGEATALHIAGGIRALAPEVAVTRLASGLPVGADLEYADELTLGRAFAGRRAL